MDILERFSSKFGKWYEGLFGEEGGDLRPKDVLRKIISAMEDNRREGLDNKVYVPNKYVLELAMDDPEERDYLLSFLDEEELVSVLKKFMAQHQYNIRGPLDFTVQEVPAEERGERSEKLKVKVRFEKGEVPAKPEPVVPAPIVHTAEDDLATVAAVRYQDDEATIAAVAWASLSIESPDGRKRHESITRPITLIGRSRNAGNDLVLSDDGQISKQHAKIIRESDGRFSIQDTGSTNGVLVNGQRIDGARILADGDSVRIGATILTFHGAPTDTGDRAEIPAWGGAVAQSLAGDQPRMPRQSAPRRSKLVVPDGTEHVLASETLIGRALTADIVLDAPGISMRHARIVSPDPATYFIEDLGSETGTLVNGRPIAPRLRSPLVNGDTIRIGSLDLRFIGG